MNHVFIMQTNQLYIQYIILHILCALNVVLFTKWTLAAQTVDQTIRKSYGTKSLHHF